MNPANSAYRLLLLLAVSGPGAIAADDFPPPRNTEPSATRPLSASEAAAGFRAPAGFRVGVFAAEPDVQNPVAMAWDRRGRLWIAENFTYAEQSERFDLRQRDRVLIFEDTDADGRADRRTVFTDDVQRLASVELGLGGVWLLCPPRLLFVPDRDGNDVPDGPAEVALDGFSVAVENHHTFANGLRWGPDGWLYGRCGASSPGQVGIPGTPDAPPRARPRRPLAVPPDPEAVRDAGPRHDESLGPRLGRAGRGVLHQHGQRPPLAPDPRRPLHAAAHHRAQPPRLRPHRPARRPLPLGQLAPLTYGSKVGPEDARLGGGHAHSGLMIYLADQWPSEYRGRLFTLNFHGRRVNEERLERLGSGYVGRHEPDMLFAADPWFRGIDLGYGPDGGVYLLDWSDTGECHDHDGVHRTSGRIYKVTHGDPGRSAVPDLSKEDEARADRRSHRHPNEWFVRQARRELADRAARGVPMDHARPALRSLFDQDPDPVRKLRALWSLYGIGGADTPFLLGLLDHPHESVRAWAIRLLTDDMPIDSIFSQRIGPDVTPPPGLMARLTDMARDGRSGLVRLVLASTIQRLPVAGRVALARALLAHPEDANDHNLPPLIWTGLIPVADADPPRPRLAGGRRADVRGDRVDRPPTGRGDRRAAGPGQRPARRHGEPDRRRTVSGRRGPRRRPGRPLQGEEAGGLGRVPGLLARSNDRKLREDVRELDVLFGDGRALDEVRRLALDDSAGFEERKAALRTLIDGRPPDLRSVCERLVRVRFVNAVAVRGLALFDDPEVGRTLARNYRSFHPSERSSAIEVLVSRPSFARALLDQVDAGKIPREDVSPFHARQIQSLADPALSRRLGEVWGALACDSSRPAGPHRRSQEDARPPGARRGRSRPRPRPVRPPLRRLPPPARPGGQIGPDLTGSGRDNIDYLLENIVDPGATVSADFKMVVVAMHDGRVLNGMVKAQSVRTLTLQTQTEAVNLDRSEIERLQPSTSSLMPDGLLDPLKPDEIRDLIAYLSHPAQVPLPAGAHAAALRP